MIDLPDDDSLWGQKDFMRARVVQIPFISRSKTGSLDSVQIMETSLKDNFVFIKFPVKKLFYKLYVYEVPVGNPKADEEESQAYFPIFESRAEYQSGFNSDVIKTEDRGKYVYRISTKFFHRDSCQVFFFDPELRKNEFKIIQSELLSNADLAFTRLEVTGIFGTGIYLDSFPRFKSDGIWTIYFFVLTLVVLSTMAGLCGHKLHSIL